MLSSVIINSNWWIFSLSCCWLINIVDTESRQLISLRWSLIIASCATQMSSSSDSVCVHNDCAILCCILSLKGNCLLFHCRYSCGGLRAADHVEDCEANNENNYVWCLVWAFILLLKDLLLFYGFIFKFPCLICIFSGGSNGHSFLQPVKFWREAV